MSETFQPRCLKNQVILMERADYGRMRIGRCITAEEVDAHRSVAGDDPRYFGCSADVLVILHRKCSGRSECEVRSSEISAENIKPCFPGLSVYLEVSYSCITGTVVLYYCSKKQSLTIKGFYVAVIDCTNQSI